jgi:hypothetical protein
MVDWWDLPHWLRAAAVPEPDCQGTERTNPRDVKVTECCSTENGRSACVCCEENGVLLCACLHITEFATLAVVLLCVPGQLLSRSALGTWPAAPWSPPMDTEFTASPPPFSLRLCLGTVGAGMVGIGTASGLSGSGLQFERTLEHGWWCLRYKALGLSGCWKEQCVFFHFPCLFSAEAGGSWAAMSL